MATRLYFVATTAAPISPAFDGSWQSTSGAVRRTMARAKAAATEGRNGVAVTSGAGNETLAFQLVSEPLAAQTITTAGQTLALVSRGRELATSDNINQRLRAIKVVSSDGGTVRGTLKAFGNGGGTTELSTTLSGQQHLTAASVDNQVVCQDGDRLLVEIGYGLSGTGTSPQYDCSIGGNGTDHANSNNDTTGTVPWVEFSQNLVFLVQGSGAGSFGGLGTASGEVPVGGPFTENIVAEAPPADDTSITTSSFTPAANRILVAFGWGDSTSATNEQVGVR